MLNYIKKGYINQFPQITNESRSTIRQLYGSSTNTYSLNFYNWFTFYYHHDFSPRKYSCWRCRAVRTDTKTSVLYKLELFRAKYQCRISNVSLYDCCYVVELVSFVDTQGDTVLSKFQTQFGVEFFQMGTSS